MEGDGRDLFLCSVSAAVIAASTAAANAPDDPHVAYRIAKQADMLVLKVHDPSHHAPQRHCASCPADLRRIQKVRFCHYTGKLYCPACHQKAKSVIPARVVFLWDFRQYDVSVFAKSHIQANLHKPLLRLDVANPRIYQSRAAAAAGLLRVRDLRMRVFLTAEFVHTCRSEARLLEGLGSRAYVLQSPHLYSLHDLLGMQARQRRQPGPYETWLRTAHRRLLEHIGSECTSCKGKGNYCEICNSRQLIFAFQTDVVRACGDCGALYHARCFPAGMACPKCRRIACVRGKR